MLILSAAEQAWLEAYRAVLNKEFPGLVEQVIIFGSKARGTATADSDLDVLIARKRAEEPDETLASVEARLRQQGKLING